MDEAFIAYINEVLASLADQPGFGPVIADLESGWKPIVYMAGGSILITFVYIWLLKCLTRPILYISIFVILGAFIGLGYYAYSLKDSDTVVANGQTKYYEIGAYILWVVSFIYFCCVMCCWNNLALGGAIMEASSEFILQNCIVIFMPVIAYLEVMIFVAFWIVAGLYLYTVGDPVYKSNMFVNDITQPDNFIYYAIGYLFFMLWVINFLIAL